MFLLYYTDFAQEHWQLPRVITVDHFYELRGLPDWIVRLAENRVYIDEDGVARLHKAVGLFPPSPGPLPSDQQVLLDLLEAVPYNETMALGAWHPTH